MKTILARNPANRNEAHVFYDMMEAGIHGETRHPQVVVRELSHRLNFDILDAVPQSLFDGWSFWIRFYEAPDLPFELFRAVNWIPVGETG